MLWVATIAAGGGGNNEFGSRFIGNQPSSLLEGLIGPERGGVSSFWLGSQKYLVPQRGTGFADLRIDTCKSVEADGSLHAGNPGRRLLDGARGGTLEKISPSEGTFSSDQAADSGNETIAVGGGNDVVVIVAVGDGDKVGGLERHGLF